MTLYRATAEGPIPMTAEEEAIFLADQAAMSLQDAKGRTQAQIDQLERDSLLNRGSRELELRLMEKEAVDLAAAAGVTVEAYLATVPYYVRLKTLNDQITALRAQL